MASSTIPTYNPAHKFDGSNYLFWRIRMETYLQALGCDIWKTVVDGKTTSKKKSKSKLNTQARTAILSGLSDCISQKVIECTSAKAIWDRLQSLYESDSTLISQSAKVNTSQTFCRSSDERSSNDSEHEQERQVLDESSDDDMQAQVFIEGELLSALEDLRIERKKTKQLTRQLEEAREWISQLENTGEEIKKVNVNLHNSLSSKHDDCIRLERDIANWEGQVSREEEKCNKLEEKIDWLTAHVKESKFIIEELETQIIRRDKRVNHLEEETIVLRRQLSEVEKVNPLHQHSGDEATVQRLQLSDMNQLCTSSVAEEIIINLKLDAEKSKVAIEDLTEQLTIKIDACSKLDKEVTILRAQLVESEKAKHKSKGIVEEPLIVQSRLQGQVQSSRGKKRRKRAIQQSTQRRTRAQRSQRQPQAQKYDSARYVRRSSYQRQQWQTFPLLWQKPRQRTTSSWQKPTTRFTPHFPGWCYSCNAYGHMSIDCRYNIRYDNKRKQHSVKCFRCHKHGHFARDCMNLAPYKQQKQWKKKNAAKTEVNKIWKIKQKSVAGVSSLLAQENFRAIDMAIEKSTMCKADQRQSQHESRNGKMDRQKQAVVTQKMRSFERRSQLKQKEQYQKFTRKVWKKKASEAEIAFVATWPSLRGRLSMTTSPKH